MRRPALRNFAYALTGLAAFFILAPLNASACRCPEHVTSATYYKKAQFVVTGKVLEVHANAKGDVWTATVTVDRAWKAAVPKTISISTSTTCAFDFTQGAEYLLYLFPTKGGGYYTSKCVGNLPLAKAEPRRKWLEQHASAASTTGP
jgi:hypothetical protein